MSLGVYNSCVIANQDNILVCYGSNIYNNSNTSNRNSIVNSNSNNFTKTNKS